MSGPTLRSLSVLVKDAADDMTLAEMRAAGIPLGIS